jgi:hypothetical protein
MKPKNKLTAAISGTTIVFLLFGGKNVKPKPKKLKIKSVIILQNHYLNFDGLVGQDATQSEIVTIILTRQTCSFTNANSWERVKSKHHNTHWDWLEIFTK